MATDRKGSADGGSAASKRASRSRTTTRSEEPSEKGTDEQSGNRTRSSASRNGSSGRRGLTAGEVAKAAARQLAELTGQPPEAVTALSRTDEGWQVELDVVEIHRVPETADVIAVYRADLDDDGQLVSYRRTQRFVRSQTREE